MNISFQVWDQSIGRLYRVTLGYRDDPISFDSLDDIIKEFIRKITNIGMIMPKNHYEDGRTIFA